MDLESLTDEQKAKLKACETSEQLLALAKEEGYELTDEDLKAVSGGWGDSGAGCSGTKYGGVIH